MPAAVCRRNTSNEDSAVCKGELRDGIAIAAIKKNGDDSTVKKKEGVLCRTDWHWL